MTTVVESTPIETYRIGDIPVLVKREDLCCPYPGPSFSKMRGVVAHIARRPEKVIGVLDTYHSKAGWAVSYACAALGKQAVNFWPRYVADAPRTMRKQQQEAQALGAEMIDVKAGRSAVLYHGAKRSLAHNWTDSYMMPNALKLRESVTENAAEARRSASLLPRTGTLVISISSGTVAGGVLRGLMDRVLTGEMKVILHMGYSRSIPACQAYIEGCAGYRLPQDADIVDEGFDYGDKVDVDVPFPCNPYYDAKTWKWLSRPENIGPLAERGPIIFWNIGE